MEDVFKKVKYIPGRRGKLKNINPIITDENIRQWEIKRAKIRKRLECVLGGIPPKVPVDVVEGKRKVLNEHTRVHLKIKSLDGDIITAYLLIPDKKPESNLFKAVIAMHQTVPQGKEEPAGINGMPNYFYGLELVKKGYLVLIPDVEAAGERIVKGEKPYVTDDFYKRYPNWSYMGKMLYDHKQCIEYLYSRNDVDKTGIGVIGHSKGGHNAIFLAALDERVKVTVSSCGYHPVTGERDKKRWIKKHYVHIKPIEKCIKKHKYYPFEFHEILACIAPRACYTWYTKLDGCFPNYKGVEVLNRLAKPVYDLYDKSDFIVYKRGNEGHDFPPYARRDAYQFIKLHL